MTEAENILNKLSVREREVFELVTDGHPNKVIAAQLGIVEKTVEAHRAKIMKKTGATGLAGLITLRRQLYGFPC